MNEKWFHEYVRFDVFALPFLVEDVVMFSRLLDLEVGAAIDADIDDEMLESWANTFSLALPPDSFRHFAEVVAKRLAWLDSKSE